MLRITSIGSLNNGKSDVFRQEHMLTSQGPLRSGKKATKRTKARSMIHCKESVLEWPGNSLGLKLIENVSNMIKNMVQEVQPPNINELKDILKHLWITLDIEYFKKLTNSMPQRLKNVIQTKGCMTKYLISKLTLL